VLGLDEETLYANLEWLAGAHAAREDRLFGPRPKTTRGSLFWYDGTRSYFAGTHNALAAFGSQRDGKKGTLQMVLGLLCAEEGQPVSLAGLPGKTPAPHTGAAQVAQLKGRFGVTAIPFVGDRGMSKS
jgi:transposase